MKLRHAIAAAAVCSLLAAAAHAEATKLHVQHKAPSPPGQPANGPGSQQELYKDIRATPYSDGRNSFWIIEPEHAEKPLPVVVFNHGWGSGSPDSYGGWIGHIVRRGNIVIYPQWRSVLQPSSTNATLNAIDAVEAALIELKKSGHAKADTSHFAIIGHLTGGLISANMAAIDSGRRLPNISALMIINPGNVLGAASTGRVALYNSLANIPAQTLMLVLTGDEDHLVGDADARKIFTDAGSAPENKSYIIVHSDHYGQPPLIADHLAALAIGTPWNHSAAPMKPVNIHGRYYNPTHIDALDYYAYWKLFDALTDAAFFGHNRDMVLGNTKAECFMGKWSNGQPVRPLTVLTSLPAPSESPEK